MLLALTGTAGCRSGERSSSAHAQRHEFAAVHMGVPVRLVLYAPADHAAAAARAAYDRIALLEDILSDWRPQSELRRLEPRAGEWVPVSAELFAVLSLSTDLARRTDGAFDPTVGPLVALWRRARATGALPSAAAIDSARALVGWRMIELDTTRRAVRLAMPGMRLDLGGVAKGWILDDALRALREHGVTRALVEAGGDVVVGDAPPGARGWRVDVPGADPSFAAHAAALVNEALATSGDAAQFIDSDGVRRSHVIDPRTGLGVTHGCTAHVITASGAAADALATALGVVGRPVSTEWPPSAWRPELRRSWLRCPRR
jgi:FAD:protein FMN transferase